MAYLLGFKSRSNFWYFTFFATIAAAFVTFYRKAPFIKSVYCNPFEDDGATLECYWFMQPNSRHYWNIQLHLATCLPAMALAVGQFVPAIRQKYPVIHRWNGRVTMILALIASITGVGLSEIAFGGTFLTISGSMLLGMAVLFGHYQAWTAIRAQKIHKHRQWMIRSWGWLGTVVTMRPLLVIGLPVLTWFQRAFLTPLTSSVLCERLLYMSVITTELKIATPPNFFKEYAGECLKTSLSASNISSLQYLFDIQSTNRSDTIPQVMLDAVHPGATAIVPAVFDRQRLDQTVALADIVFGLSLWITLAIQVTLTEIYLNRTQAEHDRLKRVSDRLRKAQSKIE